MIQIDMFEVQLGASLLLQFHTPDDKTVRVLADGGDGVGRRDVCKRLGEAMTSFGDHRRRIDLLVGTHYDADHLDGLVPIIKDPLFTIKEAWLPPVANDVASHAVDEPLDDHQFLARQLYSDNLHLILSEYLEVKARICQLLRSSESKCPYPDWRIKRAHESDLPELEERFRAYRRQAISELGADPETYSHADENAFDPASTGELLGHLDWVRCLPYTSGLYCGPWWDCDRFGQSSFADVSMKELRNIWPCAVRAHNLAAIRKSAATDAINAISLARVTKALRDRSIPIRCQTIDDGTPRRFVWSAKSQRFEAGCRLSGQGPTIMLLGPSRGLVRKHWDRLPIGVYADIAVWSLYMLKSITPSNQLSYVMRFSAENQGILVAGDAGCVDFKPKGRRQYYPRLLKELSQLHVVQVAHHAGNNAHFYRVLSAAKSLTQEARSFLLVSHATHDRVRPSNEFRQFLEHVRRDTQTVHVLFTTQPLQEKISDFASLIHCSVGPVAHAGDVRLRFRCGKWKVEKHAISI